MKSVVKGGSKEKSEDYEEHGEKAEVKRNEKIMKSLVKGLK